MTSQINEGDIQMVRKAARRSLDCALAHGGACCKECAANLERMLTWLESQAAKPAVSVEGGE